MTIDVPLYVKLNFKIKCRHKKYLETPLSKIKRYWNLTQFTITYLYLHTRRILREKTCRDASALSPYKRAPDTVFEKWNNISNNLSEKKQFCVIIQ